MAVSLAATIPADAGIAGTPNLPLCLTLSGPAVLDEDLLSVELDGVTYSVASGNLATWVNAAGTELHAEVVGDYWGGPGATHSYDVTYDATSWTGRTFVTGTLPEGVDTAAMIAYSVTSATMLSLGVAGEVAYLVAGLSVEIVRGDLGYVVNPPTDAAMDVSYLAAAIRLTDLPANGVAGAVHVSDQPGSGIVRGWQAHDVPAAGIVQGWVLEDVAATGIVGGDWVYTDVNATGIVGARSITDLVAAGVVRAVNRRNSIDVQVIDASAYTAIATAGVTWS